MHEAIDYFIAAKRSEGRSPQTLENYSARLTRFARWAGNSDLNDITVTLVRNYIFYLQETGMRAASVAGYVRPLKVFCRFMVSEELMLADPFKRVKVPSVEKRLHDLISDTDFRALIASCDLKQHEGRRDAAILHVLYDTGIRVGELIAIKHDHVDTKGGYIKVFGKGNKERIVFFSTHTAMALTRYTSRTPARFKAEWLFTSLRRNVGGQMTGSGVHQMLARLAKRTGVKSRVNPHTFRHTFATNYLRAGGDLNSLMRLMGHADLSILQTYLSLVTDDLRAKHEQFSPMARVMSGGRK